MATGVQEPETVPAWRDLPLTKLTKLPRSTREHLERQGIATVGEVMDSIDECRDIGLGDVKERVNGEIQDLINADGPEDDEDEDEDFEGTDEEASDESAAAAGNPGETPQEILPSPAMIGCPNCLGSGTVQSTDGDEAIRCSVCNGKGGVSAPATPEANPSKVTVEYVSDETFLRQIQDAQQQVDDQEDKISGLKEDLKDENKELESRQLRLANLIRQSREGHGAPTLFDQPPQEQTASNGETSGNPLDELWRRFPLERWPAVAGLPMHIVGKLAAHEKGILTVGDLADYQKPLANDYVRKLTDIEKIGKGAAEKIEEANDAFWAWWKAGGEKEFTEEIQAKAPKADAPETLGDTAEPSGGQRAEAS